MPLPRWVEPQLCKLATKAPSGAQWAREIKLDGYRMAARIEDGRVKLLTRSGHDWTAKVITETSKLDIRTGPRSVTPLNFRLTASLKLSWRTVGAVATQRFQQELTSSNEACAKAWSAAPMGSAAVRSAVLKHETLCMRFLLIQSSHGQQAYWDELSFKEPAAVLKPIKSRLTSKAPATTIIPARGLNAMRRTPCPPSLTRGWSLRMTISASLGMALILNGGRC